MEVVDTLIPDNEGNHLVVALYFYDDYDKESIFQIPSEYISIDIADINIHKIDMTKPLGLRSFFKMCNWLIEEILIFPNAVFTFICSTEPLETNHSNIASEQYRWRLFEHLLDRSLDKLSEIGIETKNIIVGPEGYQTFAKVFYRSKHAPIIHCVAAHIENKY